jgi:galactose mutarotase-like enzyme
MAASGTVEAKKENVLIRAGACAVTILTQFGGKISSIRVRERELLQAPLAPIATRTRTMAFDQGDASGWDECLPSVAACTVKTRDGAVQIPDHGDLWRTEWEIQGPPPHGQGPVRGGPGGIREQGTGNSVTLRGECFSLPLALTRTTALAESKNGWRLSVDYTLTNTGRSTAPWSWAVHPLFAVEEGDRIEIPASIGKMRVEGSGGGRLDGKNGPVTWPHAQLSRGGTTDLRRVEGPTSEIGDKLFSGRLQTNENWCVLHRQSAGLRIRMSFDAAATPYLGLWLCYGGWPERAGSKQMCVAVEPSTAPVDSLAKAGEWSRELAPGKSSAWSLYVDIEGL